MTRLKPITPSPSMLSRPGPQGCIRSGYMTVHWLEFLCTGHTHLGGLVMQARRGSGGSSVVKLRDQLPARRPLGIR